jgi:hypothetical protein
MSVYADQHRHVTLKTTDSSYVYYDCRGATVGERGSMAWMPAYIAVRNLLSMISMIKYGPSIAAVFNYLGVHVANNISKIPPTGAFSESIWQNPT